MKLGAEDNVCCSLVLHNNTGSCLGIYLLNKAMTHKILLTLHNNSEPKLAWEIADRTQFNGKLERGALVKELNITLRITW